MKTINQFIPVVSIAVLLGACGKGSDSSPKPGQSAVSLNDGWTESSYSVGTTRVTESKMSLQQQELIRNNYRRVNLLQLPVDAKYNAMIFKINDETIVEYQNKVFVAPKIFSYGSQQGGKLVPVRNSDGTVTLSFNVALVDGLSKTIQSSRADDQKVSIPDAFIVQKQDEFADYLKRYYSVDTGLSVLPGCPKRITVLVGSKEYDATPKNFAVSDHCQVNQPITASITVPSDEARMMMEEGLDAGMVDIQAVYETRVSYPVSKIRISFDRSRIFSDIQSELGVKAWFFDVDVKVAVKKVMQQQMAKILVQGDSTEMLDQMISKVMDQFFEKFEPDASAGAPKECGSAAVCFRYNSSSTTQSNVLEFSYDQATNSMAGQNYLTSTKLKSTPSLVSIGRERSCQANCDRLVNNDLARETGLTVVEGNKLVIEPDYIVRKSYSFSSPKVTRTDNSVCVRKEKVCGDTGAEHHPYQCEMVCVYENQWIERTLYDSGQVQSEVIDQPVGLLNLLFGGLSLEFRWVDSLSGKEKRLECPLAAFGREGNGKTLSVRLENVPSCKPFSGIATETPLLYLINRINEPTSFIAGERIRYWNGKVEERTSNKIYIPEIEFAGSLRVPGYSFVSQSSNLKLGR